MFSNNMWRGPTVSLGPMASSSSTIANCNGSILCTYCWVSINMHVCTKWIFLCTFSFVFFVILNLPLLIWGYFHTTTLATVFYTCKSQKIKDKFTETTGKIWQFAFLNSVWSLAHCSTSLVQNPEVLCDLPPAADSLRCAEISSL